MEFPSQLESLKWVDGLLHKCRITHDAVYIDDVRLPNYIAENGVTVVPGSEDQLNRVVVTFLVGDIHVEDDAAVKAVPITTTRFGADDVPAQLSAYTELEVTKGNEG